VLVLAPGQEVTMASGGEELLVLPLAGACTVLVDGQQLDLHGRPDVFSRVTDFAYVPRDAGLTVRSAAGGRFALPGALASRRLPARYGPARDVPVEIRGAGQASRQVNNFCSPDSFETDKLTSVEVLTPAGNWSSYPPHKHDQRRPGEAELEEIYYFETGRGPAGPGLGYQRVYASSPGRPIDVLAEVRTGDVVLVPHGYHGPSMAAPGYDLYYLNVLAGPAGERSMAFCDDPAHAWIRGSWDGQPADPRLPMSGHEEAP
jgi:5-deoxy-glucuronate isomerase